MAKKGAEFKKYCNSLSVEEQMLITLRDELYGGSWENIRSRKRFWARKVSAVFKKNGSSRWPGTTTSRFSCLIQRPL